MNFRTIIQSLERIPRKQFLWWITALALLIRLALILFVSHPGQIIADPNHTLLYEHGEIAHNLYTGHGFSMHWPYGSFDPARVALMKQPPQWRGAFIPPLNPFLLYVSYLIFGETTSALYAVMLLYAVATALIPYLVYRIAILIGSEVSARISSIVAVLFIPAAYGVTTFSGSPLYQVFALAIIFFGVLASKRSTWSAFIALGLLCGFMTQLRAEFTYIGVFMTVAATVATFKHNAQVFVKVLVSLMLMVAITAPWAIRNYQLFHRVIPVVSHPWFEIWRGNNELANGTGWHDEKHSMWLDGDLFPSLVRKADAIPYDSQFEVHINEMFKQETIRFVEANPTQALSLGAVKVWYLFTIVPYEPSSRNPIYVFFVLDISLLTIVGFYQLTRSRSQTGALIVFSVFLLSYIGITFLSFVLARYQIYIFTALLPLTGLAFQPLITKRSTVAHT